MGLNISMQLKVKEVKISSGGPLIATLNIEDAIKLDLRALDRIKIKKDSQETIVAIDIAQRGSDINPGEIGLFSEVLEKFKVKNGDIINIYPEQKPVSISYIKKKVDGL